MAKRPTIAQLTAQLEASHVSYQKLEERCLALEAQLAAAKARPAARTWGPRPEREPSAFQLACQKARAATMAGGKSVIVSGGCVMLTLADPKQRGRDGAIYQGERSERPYAGSGFWFYDAELAESYEREGDYDSAWCGPYETAEQARAAYHATMESYASL